MLKELFEKEKNLLLHFFNNLELEKCEEFLNLLYTCQGIPIFCGVGKSGLVAKKFAVTLTSTCSKALFLSPTNALHGDIGIVTENDLFVIFSKSGESDELLQLVPYVKNRKAKTVALTSNASSRLAKACDLSVHLPIKSELCPYDMVPTTSTAAQGIFSDVTAIALMQMKGFSLDQYAKNHPAGRIGKRMTMQVKDLMLSEPKIPLCSPNDKLVDTLVELSNKRCGCVLIAKPDKQLCGIFTDGDLRRALQSRGPQVLQQSMQELMTATPRHISPNQLAWEAMKQMEKDLKNAITVLPVLEEKKIVGLIKLHDIVQSGL